MQAHALPLPAILSPPGLQSGRKTVLAVSGQRLLRSPALPGHSRSAADLATQTVAVSGTARTQHKHTGKTSRHVLLLCTSALHRTKRDALREVFKTVRIGAAASVAPAMIRPKSVAFSAWIFAIPSEIVRFWLLFTMINCMK